MMPKWYSSLEKIWLLAIFLGICFFVADANFNISGYFDHDEKSLSRIEKNINDKQKEDKIKFAKIIFDQIKDEQNLSSLAAQLNDNLFGLCINHHYFNALKDLEKEEALFDSNFSRQIKEQKLFRVKNIYNLFIHHIKSGTVVSCNPEEEKDRFGFFSDLLNIIEHQYIPSIEDSVMRGGVRAEFLSYSGKIRELCLEWIKADISEKLSAIRANKRGSMEDLDYYLDDIRDWNFSNKEINLPLDISKKLDSPNYQ